MFQPPPRARQPTEAENQAMSFQDQPIKKKMSLFKQALKLYETGSNVFVQRIPVRYLKRLYETQQDSSDSGGSTTESDDDAAVVDEDPCVRALQNLDIIFKDCKDKYIDMASSVEAIIQHHKDTKLPGTVLMAWELTFDSRRKQMNDPRLVGLCTCSTFAQTELFSTDPKSMSREDSAKLRPHFGSWLYIDALCSKKAGVGRLLLLNAFQLAIQQKTQGLIALSYSPRKGDVPESKRLFDQLNFEVIIPSAKFTVPRMHGTWFRKSTQEVEIDSMMQSAFAVCTRKGLTPMTAESLMWRCPG